jgi:hypothetical protein
LLQDGNDPPVFRKNLYTARISEAAAVGASVVTVSAVDKDVRPRYKLGADVPTMAILHL